MPMTTPKAAGRALRLSVLLAAGLGLVACSEEEPPKLPGERIPIRAADPADAATRTLEAPLPGVTETGFWTHAGGDASHSGGRRDGPSGAASIAWTADAGPASGELAPPASPVLAEGRIFVRDGEAGVRAFSTSGQLIWTADLTPEGEEGDDGYGGGLAIGTSGGLYVTTGYGEVASLDPADGTVRWRARGVSPYRSAPVSAEGVVTAVNRANEVVAFEAGSGQELWRAEGVSARSGGLGRGAPAAVPGAALIPFGSGEIAVIRNRSGVRIWSRSLAGSTAGEGLSAFPDVTSGPVVAGSIVIAGSAGGPLTAVDGRNGAELWSRRFGSLSPVWAAGGTVYVVTTEPKLRRLVARDGAPLWMADLEAFEDPEDREDPITWTGPVLAGDQAWVVSSDGRLRGYDGVTGTLSTEIELPGGASSGPIAAGGVIYVLTDGGTLVAVR